MRAWILLMLLLHVHHGPDAYFLWRGAGHGAGRLRLHSGSIRHYPPPQQKSASNTE
jgi:hypothetical protein